MNSMAIFRRLAACCLVCAMLFLGGCEEKVMPPGTVASVNGEYISLHSVQVFMDSRTAAVPAGLTVAKMQSEYSNALAILIAHALVRQELAARGLAVSEVELDQAIAEIRRDYGEGNLEGFLTDTSLREEDWRQMMRDSLSLKVFMERVLSPTVRVKLADVREYREKHEEDFKIPESWQVCLHSGQGKAELEMWCQALAADANSDSRTECLAAPAAEIPVPWQSDLKKMAPLTCGKFVEEDGHWRTMGLIARNPAKDRKLSELYPVIEVILRQEKLADAFDAWLAEKLAQATVKAAPELFRQPKSTF